MTSKLKDESLQHLARALYYGAIPAMAVDASGLVIDYNLALKAVVGNLLSDQRASPLLKVLDLLNSRVISGTLVPINLDRSATECRLDSPDLGVVDLVASSIACHDPLAVGEEGLIVFWNMREPSGNLRLHKRHRELLDEQLIWDTYAWSYDRILPLMPYYNEVVDRHVGFLSKSADGPILDLGAGTGSVAERLIAVGRSVTAVDSSRAMLEKLRSKPALAAALGDQLTILEATAESLSFEDQSYVGANILLALFDMRSPELVLGNAVRVLKPDGRIAVTDLKRGFRLEPILQECERQLRNLGLYDELVDDLEQVVKSNQALHPGSRSSLRIEDILEWLAGEGFQGLEIRDSHFGQCATVLGRKP